MSDNSRFNGTFEYVVEKFSEMSPGQKMYSKPCMIGKLFWKIAIQKTSNSGSDYLSVYLHCLDTVGLEKSSILKCFANVTFSILSFKVNTKDYSWSLKSFFQPGNSGWGKHHFMEWEKISNRSNGFIQDDEIIIQVHLNYSFPAGFGPCGDDSLDSKPMNQSTLMKITKSEKKIEFLEAQLSQLKIDLTSEKSNSKKISKDLKTKSAKIESLEELLKTEKLETDKKLKESQLQIDLMNEKSNTEKISEELKTKSAEFESSLGAMKEKITSLEELLKTEKLETAKKLKDLGDQLEKEKLIVEAYKEMFQKILS